MTTSPTRHRRSAEDRRAEITAAARRLFATRGYHATTTRELAREVGVSDALLYRHFPSKHAVLESVIDEALNVFGTMPPLDHMRDLPDDALLLALGAGFLDRIDANLDLLVILIGNRLAGEDPRFAQFIDRAATALATELSRRHVALNTRNAYLTARTFFGALISFVLLQHVLGMEHVDPTTPRAYLEHLVISTTAALSAASEPDGRPTQNRTEPEIAEPEQAGDGSASP